MSSYKYPASENPKGTHLREDLIDNIDRLEEYIFRKVREFTGEPSGLLIDIGAGEGRYSAFFGKNASEIVLIEPDTQRLNKAQENLNDLAAKVEVVEGRVDDAQISAQSADLVLNVHVLQHIHPLAAYNILKKASEWLKPGGIFVLCFTKKTKSDSDYNVSWVEEGKSLYGPIPKGIFELITTQQVEGALPVKKIDLNLVNNHLKSLGFELLFEEQYSPRLLDLQRSGFGRFMLSFYKRINPVVLHGFLKKTKYSKFVDVCLVLRKT
jgi:SAM-dependent methyltransferase